MATLFIDEAQMWVREIHNQILYVRQKDGLYQTSIPSYKVFINRYRILSAYVVIKGFHFFINNYIIYQHYDRLINPL